MNNTALIIIDMQKGLVDYHPYKEEEVVSNIKKLRKGAIKRGIEVIYICHDGGKGDELEKGTKGFEVIEALQPQEDQKIIVKERNSAFYETNLDEYLKEKGVKNLILCGMQTEFCIDATLKSAFEHKYQVYIAKNTTTTFSNKYWKAKETQEYYEKFIWKKRFATLESIKSIMNRFKEDKKEDVTENVQEIAEN